VEATKILGAAKSWTTDTTCNLTAMKKEIESVCCEMQRKKIPSKHCSKYLLISTPIKIHQFDEIV